MGPSNKARDGRKWLVFMKIVDMLDVEELSNIERSAREFRKKFKLRSTSTSAS